MERFHVRTGDGALLSGAGAFDAVWAQLPQWRWAARAAARPGMLALLELSYRLFLPAWPTLVVIFGRTKHLRERLGDVERSSRWRKRFRALTKR
jgi:hypothetical protein